ncbi:MAG: tRNA 5-methoxyuridine(34)/uridine 5-oxyacetic acid(34) synthase CmoB [Helicobacter sp.]|nr:tRNA 5-methoxyuridine(34)/uridine 5-oxyacetic acid(34) synthase CmoB [Helicobacter sp.]MDD7566844.1 tRNA 5-methoxyuridine(34)/uridine 5-oxyacetic acid(34) synthase CmoB [Helicobacter sp.]MDY5740179.1 tRNA 5-methoxyuridine(34)/uridine 5-oxyacetic acid(34) synthase CmoB [Helicobacter sp.]
MNRTQAREYIHKLCLEFERKNTKLNAKFLQALNLLDSLKTHFVLESSHQGINLQPQKSLSTYEQDAIFQAASALKPWRKGPFTIADLKIDSEWQSFIKFHLIAPYLNLQDKEVLDVGCNNGYYLFEMLQFAPKSLYGFDPSALYRAQFRFIDFFARSNINFYPLGIEHLKEFCLGFGKYFDCVFLLGVLYHRSDPIVSLKNLNFALKSGGEAFIDSLVIESDEDICLCPKKSYAKMSNVYFIPSISTLQGWCDRAGFKEFELLALKKTDTNEQRKSKWIDTLSLEDFLHANTDTTIEGYPPPLRGYFRMKKI